MSTFESKVTVSAPADKVYHFLADLTNHGQLMPDSVNDWEATTDGASFNIQNMTYLTLRVTGREENNNIKIEAVDEPPFEIRLDWQLEADNDATIVTFTINAALNMMMKMLASAPLQKLTEHETQRLAAIFG